MTEVTGWMIATAAGIVFFSTILRTLIGFGFALLAVPLMTLLWPPLQAVAIVAVFQTLSTLPVLVREFALVDRRLLAGVSIGALFGMVPGLWLLHYLPEVLLRVALAATFLLSIAAVLLKGRFGEIASPLRLTVIGFCSGFCQGLAASAGPPLMAGLLSIPSMEARAIRITASAVFCLLGLISLATLGAGGALKTLTLWQYAIVGIGLLAGHWVGEKMFSVVGDRDFRRLALLVLIVSALITLIPLWSQIEWKPYA